MNTHEKICGSMLYESFKKGSAVMHYGDPASKCYIILKGTANVYVPRDIRALNEEISKGKVVIPSSILSKLSKWRTQLKKQLEKYPLSGHPDNIYSFLALKRKATCELNPEIIKKLTSDLSISNANTRIISEDDDNQSESLSKSIEKSLKNSAPNESLKEFFSENEREELKKMEDLLGDFPLEYLETPEKYFQAGVFKFHFSGELKPGQMFGEVGLTMKKTRAATVICKEDCELAVLNYEDFGRILQKVERKIIESRVEFFKEKIFVGIPVDVVIRLSLLFKKRKYFQGNTVYEEGDIATEMFLIKKGEVQVFFLFFIGKILFAINFVILVGS